MALASLDDGLFGKVLADIDVAGNNTFMPIMIGSHIYAIDEQSAKGKVLVITLCGTVQEPKG